MLEQDNRSSSPGLLRNPTSPRRGEVTQDRTLTQKLLWFVALWLLGTGSVAALAYVLRLWIAPH